MSITRYKFGYDGLADCLCDMDVHDDGDYVEYDEYEKLRDYLENLASTTPHKFLIDEIKELLK